MLRAALLLLAVTAALRAETFFHPLILPADEGAYFRLTYQWLVERMPLYTGTFDHKPPGIYYIYALCMRLGGAGMMAVRWGGLIASWAGAVLCYGFGKRLADTGNRSVADAAGMAAGLAYAILSCRLTGLNGNLEVFFNPLIIALLGMAWQAAQPQTRSPALWMGAAGLLGGAVFMTKYTAGAQALGLPAIWYAGRTLATGIHRKTLPGAMLLFGLGALVPVAAVCLHFTVEGPGVAFLIERTITRNLAHKAGASGSYKALAYLYFIGRAAGEYALGWAAGAGFLVTHRRWPAATASLLPGWLLAGAVSAGFTGHLFDHYLIECLPPLCLMLGLWVGRLALSLPRTGWAVAGLLTLIFLPLGADEARRQWPALPADVAAWRRGHHIWAGDATFRLANYLNKTLAPGQHFFAVEGSPTLYMMSGRDLPTAYTYWPMLVKPHYGNVSGIDQAAEIGRILRLPPRLIVAREKDIAGMGSPGTFEPALARQIQREVDAQYALRDTVAGWWVWERR